MKQLYKLSSTWFPIWLISLLMFIMVSVYLPVFSGANQNLIDVPLIVVNEDRGHMGDAILLKLIEKQNGNSFKWEIANNKQEALNDLKNDKAYGALIIPANYSKGLSQVQELLLSGNDNGKAATLEILLNEGVGQSASMIASNTFQAVASATSEALSRNFKNELNEKGITLSPDNALLLDTPVKFTMKNVLGLPVNLNKGMTPFVMALIISITGLMGANMIHGYLMRGNGILKKNESSLSESKILTSELIFGAILSFCVSVILQSSVFGFFGSSHATSIRIIFLFTFFCCITMFFLFKSLALLFGGWGMLVMFPVNIMGIFSSGGAIPLSTLPVVHRIFSSILPTRYMVDGMRALLYYNGRMQAGLGTALWALSIYFIITLAIVITFIRNTNRRQGQIS
ncbi:ABC transporter permease [Peribacillus sp. JNUCC 23]